MAVNRISLNQVRSLPDIIPADNFLLVLGSLPGNGNTKNLAIKCMNCTVPGIATETFEVKMWGHTVTHRGQRVYSHILQTIFLEDRTYDSTRTLFNYQEAIANVITGNGVGTKGAYENNTAMLYIYDQRGKISASYQFIGFYLKEIADGMVDGSSTQPLQIQATWCYDYYVPSFSNSTIQNALSVFGINFDLLNQANQIAAQFSNITANALNTPSIVNNAGSAVNNFSSSGLSPFSTSGGF